MSPATSTHPSVLTWFAIPSTLAFLGVNIFQISPILASWTTVSVFGMDGATLHWIVLIVTYSLILALLCGACCYWIVASRRGP